jgi:hypothetical protein
LAVALINTGGNKSLDKVLADIERMPSISGLELKHDAVQKVVMDDQDYIITYGRDGTCVTVTYSGKEGRVIKLEREQPVQAAAKGQ